MTVASDLVNSIVARLFEAEQIEFVQSALLSCSTAAPAGERDRVQVAVLKLYDEDTNRDLAAWARAAEQDYRDVLYWAETPGQAALGARPGLSATQLKAVRAADRAQFATWLKRVT